MAGPDDASTSYTADFRSLTLLQKGDNDTRKKWGGKTGTAAGTAVNSLQRALAAVGCFNYKPDGDFGGRTVDAVKRFQWYLNTLTYRLLVAAGTDESQGRTESFTAPTGIKIDGLAASTTLVELANWVDQHYMTTTPLVRLNIGAMSNTELSPDFTVMAYPSPAAKEALVHADFVATMTTLNAKAKDASLTLRLNQCFRDQSVPPSGAVVAPASKSQHLIGHAVDLNIVDGTTVNTSAMFKATPPTATQKAKDFVKTVKTAGIRWGGDFGDRDPPHFDDFVDPGSDAYANNFFFAQRCYAHKHPVRSP